MKLTTKLGLTLLSLGLLANISGKCLSKYYNNQKNTAAAVLESAILQTNSMGIELDEAISNFEKYEGRRDYADGVRYLSCTAIALGGALAFGGKRIRINVSID